MSNDELAGKPGGAHAARVEEKAIRSPFPAAPLLTSVKRKPQLGPEHLQEGAQGGQVSARLLDRDDVEAGDDLGKTVDVEEIASRRVACLGAPLGRQVAEGADAPGADQEVAIELLGGDRHVERLRELAQRFGELGREWVSDLRRMEDPLTARRGWKPSLAQCLRTNRAGAAHSSGFEPLARA